MTSKIGLWKFAIVFALTLCGLGSFFQYKKSSSLFIHMRRSGTRYKLQENELSNMSKPKPDHPVRLKEIVKIPLLYQMAKDVFDEVPDHFLPDFKNPCWYEHTTSNSLLFGQPSNKQRLLCLPYYYILGAAKCGSSDVWSRILAHPHVYKKLGKETFWWSAGRNGKNFKSYVGRASNMADILLKNHSLHHKLIYGDGTPTHFWENGKNDKRDVRINPFWGRPPFTNADLLHAVQPDAKYIVTIREPAARTYSDYLHFRTDPQRNPKDFHNAVVKALDLFQSCINHGHSLYSCTYERDRTRAVSFAERMKIGIYVVFLRDWLSVFPRDQMLIMKLEDLIKNCKGTLQKLFDFLDLDKLTDENMDAICKRPIDNVSQPKFKVKIQPMYNTTRKLLEDFFTEPNRQLGELLGPDLTYRYNRN